MNNSILDDSLKPIMKMSIKEKKDINQSHVKMKVNKEV